MLVLYRRLYNRFKKGPYSLPFHSLCTAFGVQIKGELCRIVYNELTLYKKENPKYTLKRLI